MIFELVNEYPDPDDFKIKPRTATFVRRSLSGKLYGHRSDKRAELQLDFASMGHVQAQALLSYIYEATVLGPLHLYFKRASSSDIQDCTNAFKGTVKYVPDSYAATIDPGYTRDITLTFEIHSYEAF